MHVRIAHTRSTFAASLDTAVFVALSLMLLVAPVTAGALDVDQSLSQTVIAPDTSAVTAKSYIVVNKLTGQEIISKDKNLAWSAASMTKLMTVMVALDMHVKPGKIVTMQKGDELGLAGFYRMKTKPGIKYTVKDLMYASLLPSANNAANALARSTGLTRKQFVAKMNAKAKALGATHTTFVDPSGASADNMTTAEDFAKIATAAFVYPEIKEITTTKQYTVRAVNSKRYVHRYGNTNKLLQDASVLVQGGKTGHIPESEYNLATDLKNGNGHEVVVVVLGSKDKTTEFQEALSLATWSWLNHRFE